MITPDVAPRREFHDPDAAMAHVSAIYDAGVAHLRERLMAFVAGEVPGDRVRATYPYRARPRRHRAARRLAPGATASSPAPAATKRR